MTLFRKLNWIQRLTIILGAIVTANWAMASFTGYSLIGGDLFVIFFLGFLTLLAVLCLRPLSQRLLWRVRNRLFVTYFLIGLLPVALLITFVVLGFYLVLGQTANYLLHAEIDRRLDQVYVAAGRLAEDYAAGRDLVSQAGDRVLVRIDERSKEFPGWSKPGFKGIVVNASGDHFFAAQAESNRRARQAEVFVYRPLNNQMLAELMSGLASITIIAGDRVQLQLGRFENGAVRVPLKSADVAPTPPPVGFWDIAVESPTPLSVRSLEDGRIEAEALILETRSSAMLARLFSTLGSFARILAFALLVVAVAFLTVEFIAILFSARLTRTLTRAVHDLYIGTKRVEAGDLSHRIPVRTKDQLSELAGSFNSMTAQISRLIAEVKEKEKLQAELEVARQVQAQLFPKEVPKLKTLELAGICNPARIVSGDYYDFVPFDSRSTALVIGDISGKGISAALLMASLQSSLHAQLAIGSNEVVSTAAIVSRLNRQFYENSPPEKYATFYCGVYNDEQGRLHYTNAGHLAPILVRRGTVLRLESNGMAVGMFPDFPFQQACLDLQQGDLLVAFTDGITESENVRGEQFGEERLTEMLIRSSDRPLDDIVKTVTESVSNWASDPDNQDDTTILLARRL
jgi:sigma-B regulation protein RsbU (phosphoserine phosphatase)